MIFCSSSHYCFSELGTILNLLCVYFMFYFNFICKYMHPSYNAGVYDYGPGGKSSLVAYFCKVYKPRMVFTI
jgi:hypothetical protein